MFGRCAGTAGPFASRNLTIQDVFEAIGAYNAGKISLEQFKDVEDHACPGAGACGGQFTANTMATAYEMLGMSPMGWNDIPAIDPAQGRGRLRVGQAGDGPGPARASRRARSSPARASRTPSPASWRPADRPMPCCTCWRRRRTSASSSRSRTSTASRSKTPVVADLKPWGTYTAPEMYDAGGMAVVGKRLLEAGLLHARSKRSPGRTIGEEIKRRAPEPPGQQVIKPLARRSSRRAASRSCAATWPPAAA